MCQQTLTDHFDCSDKQHDVVFKSSALAGLQAYYDSGVVRRDEKAACADMDLAYIKAMTL
jgi:hypothetical protein